MLPDASWPAPFVPSDEAQILERLPVRSGAEWDEIAALRARSAAEPRRTDLAAELARRYLDVYRADGDPRLVGYARAALAPWANASEPPVAIALQGALVAQTEHRFADAQQALDALMRRAPREPQAPLAAAALALTRGDYERSRKACARLLLIEDSAVAATCLAAVQAVTGKARDAYALLTHHLESVEGAPDDRVALWIHTLAAETALVLDVPSSADRHFRAALDIARRGAGRPSIYLLAAYADFLLDRSRPADVLALLRDAPPADGILLRAAAARKRLGLDVTSEAATLRHRLQLALAGEEDAHAREAAYLELHVLDEPERALDLALRNWAEQREPIDARLVLEAAVRAGAPDAAAPVMQWLEDSGFEDARLRRLQAALGASR